MCIRDRLSAITGVDETTNTSIGSLFGSAENNNTATGKMSGCAILVPSNSFQQVDATFKTRVTSGYTNPGVYQ